MSAERTSELAALYGLDAEQADQLAALAQMLSGDPHAPISPATRPTAIDAHIADSLTALAIAEMRAARTIVDIGSGAGLPGLVLAVALPRAEVSLVESNARKADFIAVCAKRLGLTGARAVRARAEELDEARGRFDVVSARALAPQPTVLEYAAPLLRVGGALVDWRGRRDAIEEAASLQAARELGLALREIRPVAPFPGADEHHLHVFAKQAPTPDRFPRRAGVARRRPLGGG